MTSALELLRPSSVARAQLPRCKAVELRALRESFRRSAEEKPAGPVVTALYVLIRPDQDPAARPAAAGRAGYAVAKVHAGETPRTRGGVRRPAARTAGGA